MNKTVLTNYRSIALLVVAAHVGGILLATPKVKVEPPMLSLTMVDVGDSMAESAGEGEGGGATAAAPVPTPVKPQAAKKEAAPVKEKTAAPAESKLQPVVKKVPEVKPEAKPKEAVPTPVKPESKPIEMPKPAVTPTPAPKTQQPATTSSDYTTVKQSNSNAAQTGRQTTGATGQSNSGSTANSNKKSEGSGNGSQKGSESNDKKGGGDTAATHLGGYLSNPKPPYPELSRERGEEGRVRLTVTVEPNGSPSSVRVSSSSGYPRLDKAAETAVRKYRFKPATRNGEAIRSSYTFAINFSL